MRHLRVLGSLEVDGTDKALGPRDRVVVSVLALRPGERIDAETLAEALWGEEPPVSAAKVVQGCVSRLRQCFGADSIETVSGGYRLRVDKLDLDRERFEDLVERAREHLATRSPERAIPLLTQALAMWRGPAFGELEDWMPGRLEAVRLGQLRLAAEEDLLQARLDSGDHVGVAADGTVLTGQQPFRERRWALLALAQYRCGRQADALASIRSARRALGQELGLDPGSDLIALERRILDQDPALAADHDSGLVQQGCPWKGLAPYDHRDGDTFFGRDNDIADCLAKLEEVRLLVVTGPSGSGKSSLVQAGLVPALRSSGHAVAVFTPGADGALAMAVARSSHRADPMLVIDQFEETFTLESAGFARPWLRDVAKYALESAPVVLVVRGDHVAGLAAVPDLARLAERGLHLVVPLAGESLREAIEGPAKVAGLRLEPGLIDLVMRDADDQPGALPLLSHALAETWLRRDGALLTVDGYRASGGIRDAVAASAERLYAGLDAAEQAELRWLMLHLVSLSESGQPFRTPLPAGVVADLDGVRRRLLALLVRGRLVTSHEGGYDLAHEALVRAWPRLRAWLDEDRVGQQIRRHLGMTAAGWEALGRPDAELYRGARLNAALDWLDKEHEPLAATERAFVEASRAVADDQVRRLADEARQQRRQNRRLRVLVAVAAVLVLLAAGAGGLAIDRGQDAARGRDAATEAAAAARHESILSRSLAFRSTDLTSAALLAIYAWQEEPDAAAEAALIGTVTSAGGFLGRAGVPGGCCATASVLPGEDRLLVATGTSVRVLDPATGEAETPLRRALNEIEVPSELRVNRDGTRATQLINTHVEIECPPHCPIIVVYDLESRVAVGPPIEVGFAASDVALSANGRLVSAVGGGPRGRVATWDASSGRRLSERQLGGSALTFGIGDTLLVSGPVGPVRRLSAKTLRTKGSIEVPAGSADRRLLFVRGLLVTAGERGQAVRDLRREHVSWFAATGGCQTAALSALRERVYCGTASGEIQERDLLTGVPTGRVLDAQFGGVSDLLVYRQDDGTEVLVAIQEQGQEYARWRVEGPGPGARLLAPRALATGGYDPSDQLLLASRDGHTEVLDTGTGSVVLRLPKNEKAVWLAPGVVGLVARQPMMVHVPSGRVDRLPIEGVVDLFPDPSETQAWAVSREGGDTHVHRVTLDGSPATPDIVIGNVEGVQVAAQGRQLLMAYRSSGIQGYLAEWEVNEFDSRTGTYVTVGLYGSRRVVLTGSGLIVVANEQGQVESFTNMFESGLRSLPRAQAAVTSLQVSSDDKRLLVNSADQAVQLIDLETRSRAGGPIQTDTVAGVPGGWLRHDGGALLINSTAGVFEWDLSPEAMMRALCRLAGRNLPDHEWDSYIGTDVPRRPLCPEYG